MPRLSYVWKRIRTKILSLNVSRLSYSGCSMNIFIAHFNVEIDKASKFMKFDVHSKTQVQLFAEIFVVLSVKIHAVTCDHQLAPTPSLK